MAKHSVRELWWTTPGTILLLAGVLGLLAPLVDQLSPPWQPIFRAHARPLWALGEIALGLLLAYWGWRRARPASASGGGRAT